jgi:hypothetical protein
MADPSVVHIGENSPEQVAYRLLHDVARAEKKSFGGGSIAATTDRKWILDTYAECLNAVRRPDRRMNQD